MNKPEFGKYKIELFYKLFEHIECPTIDKYYSNWTNIQNLNDQCIAYKKMVSGQIIPLSVIHKDIKLNFDNINFIKIYSNLHITIGLRNDGSIEIFDIINLSNITDLYLFNYNFLDASHFTSDEYIKLDSFEKSNYNSTNYIPFNKSDYQFKEIYIRDLYFFGIKNDDTFIIVCLDNQVVISICKNLYKQYSNFEQIQIKNIICKNDFIFILTNRNKLIYFKINLKNKYNKNEDQLRYFLDIDIDNKYIYIYEYDNILYLLDINNKLIIPKEINFPDNIMDKKYIKIFVYERILHEDGYSLFIGLTIDNIIKLYIFNYESDNDQSSLQTLKDYIELMSINPINKNFTNILLDDEYGWLFFKLDNVYILNDDLQLVEFKIKYGHTYPIYIKKVYNFIFTLDHKIEVINIDIDDKINKELYLKIKDYTFLDIYRKFRIKIGGIYFVIKK